jgi:hypothetical protein
VNVDIHQLLEEAADDTDRPMGFTPEDLTRRAERSTRLRCAAGIASVAVVVAAVVGVASAWPTHQGRSPVAGTPTATQTIDVKTGRILWPAPPVSSLTDDHIRERCAQVDRGPAGWDKTGPIGNTWNVVLKTGIGVRFYAVLLSPDGTVGIGCEEEGGGGHVSALRHDLQNHSGTEQLPLWTASSRGPANLATVTAETPDGKYLRSALVGREGFFTFGAGGFDPSAPASMVRGYDVGGRLVMERRLPLPSS